MHTNYLYTKEQITIMPLKGFPFIPEKQHSNKAKIIFVTFPTVTIGQCYRSELSEADQKEQHKQHGRFTCNVHVGDLSV